MEQRAEAGADRAPPDADSRFGGSADKLLKELVDAERARCAGDPPEDYNVIEFRKRNEVGQAPPPRPPPPPWGPRKQPLPGRPPNCRTDVRAAVRVACVRAGAWEGKIHGCRHRRPP